MLRLQTIPSLLSERSIRCESDTPIAAELETSLCESVLPHNQWCSLDSNTDLQEYCSLVIDLQSAFAFNWLRCMPTCGCACGLISFFQWLAQRKYLDVETVAKCTVNERVSQR